MIATWLGLNALKKWLMGGVAVVLWEFVGKWLICTVAKSVCALAYMIFVWVVPLVVVVLEVIPSMPTLVIEPLLGSWRIFNYLFPLNEAVSLISFVITIVIAFRLFRFIKQFVPTWSN